MELQVNQVIEELSKIDSAAEALILSSDQDKAAYSGATDAKKAEYEDSLKTKMNLNIDAYRTRMQSEHNQILTNYRKETEETLRALDASYQKHHTDWAKKIFQQIIE